MRRILYLTLILVLPLLTKAQDLIQQIPADAKLVATIKGSKFLELMSTDEFNNSYVGKKFLETVSKRSHSSYTDVQNLGIDVHNSFYYYLLTNDSISYNCFLVPIKNADTIGKLIRAGSRDPKISVEGNTRVFVDENDSSSVWFWNDKQLLIVNGMVNEKFFDRDDVAARYDIHKPSFTDRFARLGNDAVVIDSATAVVDSVVAIAAPAPEEEVVAAPKPAPKKRTTTSSNKRSVSKKKTTAPAKKAKPAKEEMEENETAEEVQNSVGDVEVIDSVVPAPPMQMDTYSLKYNAYYQKKKTIASAWTIQYAKAIFSKPVANSIATNPSYLKSVDPAQEASLWIGNTNELITSLMSGKTFLPSTNIMSGWKTMTAGLTMDKQQIKIATRFEVTDSAAKTINRMYDCKLNKKLLNYLNEDRMIGYITYSINTKNYLEEYPRIMAGVYGNAYSEEAALGADVLSLILDEEAISKVFKGDGIFVFSGLSQKEVSYKEYNYDDNYKSIEIEKKKKETLPDFMFMMSSEDPTILQKLINYGVKKNVVVFENGYYKLDNKNVPMQLYAMIKDGIVFLGTNQTDFEKIATGKFDAKLSKETKKSIMSSHLLTYFSPKKLAGKIPSEEIGEVKTMMKINNVLSKTGDIYMRSNPIQGNVLTGEITMDVPAGETNSLKYLFSLIELSVKD